MRHPYALVRLIVGVSGPEPYSGGRIVSFAAGIVSSRTGRNPLCAGFEMEVRLERQGRADCVSSSLAVEVEWTDKWKEGVGQVGAQDSWWRSIGRHSPTTRSLSKAGG